VSLKVIIEPEKPLECTVSIDQKVT